MKRGLPGRKKVLQTFVATGSEAKMGCFTVIISYGLLFSLTLAQNEPREPAGPCYDREGRPQWCQPAFVNAAYGRVVEATNTCGVSSEIEYCLQTGVTGVRKYCHTCNDRDQYRRHPPEYLTDFNNNYNLTWWQSETMLQGIQYPMQVNLTLHLKKTFDITYVNLRFYSPRPESFAIFKRTSEDGPWIPFQFYSASCENTYNMNRNGIITAANEDTAVCSSEFSDISPLTGGSVAFSTLEGRPSMFEFNSSPKLQEWVTATDIKIVLTRMNTFGEEVFGDAQVLKSYFYAISDLAVGAKCRCNGHARECRTVKGQDLQERLECVCEHFTDGPDCGKCRPFYNDQPWGRATDRNAHECQACDCSGLSDRCVFDPDLYKTTGHGGRCIDCRENTSGAHCELCEANHLRRDNKCLNCRCNPVGSRSLQCDNNGQCPCKPGVGGHRCDRCLPDNFDFGEDGCSPCECAAPGSLNNQPVCDTTTGKCACKENADGRRCDKCKPDYFGLSMDDPFGCISCFCYGHSSECTTASGYYARNISTDFSSGKQKWRSQTRSMEEVETQFNAITENLGVSAEGPQSVYFTAPGRYLGDQRFSYNQFLTFDLRIGEEKSRPSVVDIVLEGSGQSIATHIFAQSNPVPGVATNSFAFRLHNNPKYQWSPRLQPTDFITLLSNLTAIKIRATYNDKGVGFIDNIRLGSARQDFSGEHATWVESCTCPEGYIGQFCEACIPGYKRDPPNGGPFARCIPCQCNNHSDSCDVNSGRCICQDNTEGNNCERCARGFYGDATMGLTDDCQKCPCPNQGPCIQMLNGDVVCTECEEGYGGNQCNLCLDGYYGDPLGEQTGVPTPCKKCLCNGNIDTNAVANCNTTTGECRKCIRNTGGFFCEQCLPNYYNNSAGECTACNCYPPGTISQPGTSNCDVNTGQCLCLPNVVGQRCDNSAQGYYDIASGQGSKPCDCDTTGSLNYTCNEMTGQCQCKNGVTARRCDTCDQYYYGFSPVGCTGCNCDPSGSKDLQCDIYGNCPCKDNVDGRRCDRCMENKYDIKSGCLDCPQCYDLVEQNVNAHRGKLRELSMLITKTNNNPSLFNDTGFVAYLTSVNASVNVLLRDARSASTGDGTIGKQLETLRKALNDVIAKCKEIAGNIASASKVSADSQGDIDAAEKAIDNADKALRMAENYIDKEGRTALKQALDALANFGQNNKQMTEIAKRASATAENQEKEAQMIEDLAKMALATSRETHRLANESLNLPDDTQKEIEMLRREYEDANQLYQSTKTVANNTLNRAKASREEAYSLYVMAQQQLPSVDIQQLKDEALRIKDQALDIKNRAQDLVDNNQDLMMKVKNQTQLANGLLNDGDNLVLDITNLLAEADYAREEARKAKESAERTLKEANDTLTTLEEFDKLVANKDAADNALMEVPEIQKTIDEARNMTQDARNALAGVDADARRALELAKEAEEKAEQAINEARDILEKANDTKNKANTLQQEAKDLKDQDVADMEQEVKDYEDTVNDDEALAKKALQEAAAAKQKAQEAYDQVTQAHNMVKTIKKVLDDAGTVNLQQLKDLEKKLDEIDQELADSDIKNKMDNLIRKNKVIEEQADKFENELSDLQAAVKNIGDIKDSLPDGCFKTIPIEYRATP